MVTNFTKNGKRLKAIKQGLYKKPEYLNTLLDDKQIKKAKFQFVFKKINLRKLGSFGLSFALSLILFTKISYSEPERVESVQKHNIFSSKPLVLESVSSTISTQDARANKIDGVFNRYDCPMTGYGQDFIDAADEYDIPWWIVASIGFHESTCGKKTPTNGGEETFNGWGWGVWGTNAYQFDSWEHGINTVTKYMATKFFDKGITNTCDIMKIYTPPSNGSWCKSVDYFGEKFQTYESP